MQDLRIAPAQPQAGEATKAGRGAPILRSVRSCVTSTPHCPALSSNGTLILSCYSSGFLSPGDNGEPGGRANSQASSYQGMMRRGRAND
ncbi:hypothetical protein HMPREF9004_0265 [Schaalia cardiffensis F0333]|uniref:Uncharacterized protein n=1 Tax=Schaalia cardiffensis F0333 TaxID=888050 RepID=N6W8P3_9ACTO|nr:hypothetical protein HMPREF9004_0265 [Schaalia cardiffensis F0333]